ncbi:MAG: alpha/beta hydrolase [Verrucomicrobiota bacterium]|nr:alpha/beta hydrolase [Verrucomicrobiota bacterium]
MTLVCRIDHPRIKIGLIAGLGVVASSLVPVGAATLPISEGSLYYRVRGEGTPILLLTGGPGRSGDYLEPVFVHLAKSYRVILPDQRGTGRSKLHTLDANTVTVGKNVADLETLRMSLGIEKWIIMGHSWGGMLAMLYTVEHPDRVRSLVLVGSGGTTLDFFSRSDGMLRKRQTPEEVNLIKAWEKEARDPARREEAQLEVKKLMTGPYLYDRGTLPAVTETLTPQTYSSRTAELILKDLRTTKYDLRQGLHAAITGAFGKRPILILHGEQDAIGLSTEHELKAMFPAASVRILDQCGHFPSLEATRAFFAELDKFLPRSGSDQ